MSSSRIPGFYRLDVASRRQILARLRDLDPAALESLDAGGIDLETADGMIENVIGTYALPLGLALNFRVNDVDYVVPMAIEEPSVVAAASNAAKIIREAGGFRAHVSPPLMIGQVELTDVGDPVAARRAIIEAKPELLAEGIRLMPRLSERGGGLVDIEVRVLEPSARQDSSCPDCTSGHASDHPLEHATDHWASHLLVVHLVVDCRDAMGANMVNSLAEDMAERLAELAGGRVGLRILSNLADRRTVRVTARVADSSLAGDPEAGARVRTAIARASRFAEVDPYRAATHNKGIMNGVDAVVLATGNGLAQRRGRRPCLRRPARGLWPAGGVEGSRRRAFRRARDAHGRGHGRRRPARSQRRAPGPGRVGNRHGQGAGRGRRLGRTGQ